MAVTAEANPDNLAGLIRERPGDPVVTAGLGQDLVGLGNLGRAKVTPSGVGLPDKPQAHVNPRAALVFG